MPETGFLKTITRDQVLAGREAVTAYRRAHTAMHSQPAARRVHDDHTPLLHQMETELNATGFRDVADFFNHNEAMNISELGFKDRADFETYAVESDRTALEEKWR